MLVVELKKARANDSVVGKIQLKMYFVKEELADHNQGESSNFVLDDDILIRMAIS